MNLLLLLSLPLFLFLYGVVAWRNARAERRSAAFPISATVVGALISATEITAICWFLSQPWPFG